MSMSKDAAVATAFDVDVDIDIDVYVLEKSGRKQPLKPRGSINNGFHIGFLRELQNAESGHVLDNTVARVSTAEYRIARFGVIEHSRWMRNREKDRSTELNSCQQKRATTTINPTIRIILHKT